MICSSRRIPTSWLPTRRSGTAPVLREATDLCFAQEGRGLDLFRAFELLDLEGIGAWRPRNPHAHDVAWRHSEDGAYTQPERRYTQMEGQVSFSIKGSRPDAA
jgi:hypothetical protein